MSLREALVTTSLWSARPSVLLCLAERTITPLAYVAAELGNSVGSIRSGTACHDGMVTGMASKKVTITLDEAQLERIRAFVGAGMAPSVSGFVQHAVGVSLDDVAGWGALLAEALRETGGPLSDSERAWADEALGITQRGGRSAA
jgi:Arc/MetJ-type ribon-helix-helix transcriptional regulator